MASARGGENAIVVMAKWPEPGLVKTRIGRRVGGRRAARLQAKMLSDTVALLRPYHDVRLAVSPEERGDDFRALFPGSETIVQGEGDLGERMARCARLVLSERPGVILLGADSPDLPPQRLEQALSWLSECDVVLGPSLDGGVYLIGLRSCPEQLFRQIQWSSAEVFSALSARALSLGLRTRLLPAWRDVDTLGDVAAWAVRSLAAR